MAMEDVVKEVTDALKQEGNTHAVFGEPLRLDTKTIIPVACIQFGGGLGGVRPAFADASKPSLVGGGGGGGFAVYPVGYLHEEHGEVVFTPIHPDVKARPFLTEASRGLGKALDSVTTAVSAYARKALGAKPAAKA